MKTTSLFLCLIALLALANCGQSDIQLPEQELQGMVNGEDWEIKFSNAYIYSSDLKYQIKFLSTVEGGNDPCAVPSTGNDHVSMIMQLRIGSFSVPFPFVEDSPRFEWSDGNSVIATSGFLEIFDIVNSRVFGYLQAHLDDGNTVEGSFEALICN